MNTSKESIDARILKWSGLAVAAFLLGALASIGTGRTTVAQAADTGVRTAACAVAAGVRC